VPRAAAPPAGDARALRPAVAPGGERPGVFDLSIYLNFFRRPGLGSLYLQFFLFTFSFSAFMSGFALFAERRFATDGGHWTSREVGYLFAYSGFLGIILQGGLIGRLVKRFGEARLTLAGFISVVVAYVALGFIDVPPLAPLLVVTAISAFGNGVLRPVITSELTQRVGRHEQGVAIGISGSLNSLAMTIAPPTAGTLIELAGPLDHIEPRWLIVWTLLPATAAVIGLIAALVARKRTPTEPAADAARS
jgi:MFS family permease